MSCPSLTPAWCRRATSSRNPSSRVRNLCIRRFLAVCIRCNMCRPSETWVNPGSCKWCGVMEARGRRGSGCVGCERRCRASLAASVGKSRAAARRRREQRRSFLCEPRRRRRILDVRAADLQEEMAEHAFPFRQLRRRRRHPSEHRCERSEQSDRARLREQQAQTKGCEQWPKTSVGPSKYELQGPTK
jgi:hypothetical protein